MEREFIEWLRQTHGSNFDFVRLGIGDDAAVLSFDSNIVVTTDAIADGTHFDSSTASLEQIGHKALAVNFSDLAAMGAKPRAALVSFQLPRAFELQHAQHLFNGITNLAVQFDTVIVGGDTNRWDEKLQISITVIGVPFGKKTWKMSGANAGDAVLVSGTFGGSILKKHLEFEPRLKLAEYLAKNFSLAAVTDASDSLSLDLAAIASASGLGFQIDFDLIPVSNDAVELSRIKQDQQTPLDHSLYDGEDFELIICASADECDKMLQDNSMPVALTHIGHMTDSKQFLARHSDGTLKQLEVKGYCH